MQRKYLFTAALLAGVSLPVMAQAAQPAFTTANLNVRTGPESGYARIATIPEGGEVTVYGCVSGYLWCDISWQGLRGWVYSEYLAFLDNNRRYDWRSYAPRNDFPIITFSFGDYHDRYYRDRPWHRQRGWNSNWNDRWDRDRGRWWNDDHSRRRDVRGRDDDRDRDRGNWRGRDNDRRDNDRGPNRGPNIRDNDRDRDRGPNRGPNVRDNDRDRDRGAIRSRDNDRDRDARRAPQRDDNRGGARRAPQRDDNNRGAQRGPQRNDNRGGARRGNDDDGGLQEMRERIERQADERPPYR